MTTDIRVLAKTSGRDPGETPVSRGAKNLPSGPALFAGSVGLAVAMLTQVPTLVIDLPLTCSIAASILVLLSAVQVRKAIGLSDFSTLLLPLTLFRLWLVIVSSRRILLHGSEGTEAVDKVIDAPEQFFLDRNHDVWFRDFPALIAACHLILAGAGAVSAHSSEATSCNTWILLIRAQRKCQSASKVAAPSPFRGGLADSLKALMRPHSFLVPPVLLYQRPSGFYVRRWPGSGISPGAGIAFSTKPRQFHPRPAEVVR